MLNKLFQRNKHNFSQKAAAAPFSQASRQDKLIHEVVRFVCFGVFSTTTDFAVLNLLIYVFHMPEVFANMVSISAALLVGYAVNRRLVFRKQPPTKRHVGYFMVINLIGLYGLQTVVVILLSHYPLAQSTIAGFLATILAHVPFTALESNVVKLIATLASGIWNFVMVRKFVFIGKAAALPS